jgi:hypothetical protein
LTLIRVVQTPIWKWLFDVYRVLGASIEILDDRLTSLASSNTPTGGPAADLELTNEAWRAITPLSEAPGKIVSIGGRRFSCTPIMSAGSLVGAVLVAASTTSARRCRAHARRRPSHASARGSHRRRIRSIASIRAE